MDIVIHKPTEEPHTETVYQVDSFDTEERGEQNKIHVLLKDGSRETYTGVGYTVSGATTTVKERERSR